MQKTLFRLFASLALLSLLLPACAGGTEIPAEWEGRTLVGVEYGEINGMTWGDDFEIRLTEDTVVYARRFSRLTHRYVTREGRALSAKRWQDIAGAVIALMPSLEEVPVAPDDMQIPFATDGGSASAVVGSGFWLTWRASDGSTERIRYYVPSDEGFDALRALLVKAAR